MSGLGPLLTQLNSANGFLVETSGKYSDLRAQITTTVIPPPLTGQQVWCATDPSTLEWKSYEKLVSLINKIWGFFWESPIRHYLHLKMYV